MNTTISQWTDDTPVIIQHAITRTHTESVESACNWVWFQASSAAERQAVDAWLCSIQHPSAYEAGTPEQRFRGIVKEMLEEYREMDEAYRDIKE